MKAFLLFCFFLSWFPFCLTAFAHESRPVYIKIEEKKPGEYMVQWKVPRVLPPSAMPVSVLPDNCIAGGKPVVMQQANAFLNRQMYRCAGSIMGQEVGIRYPIHNPSLSTIIQIELLSGKRYTPVLGPGESSWLVPEKEEAARIARQYIILGIRHIIEGIDHLFFVFGLLLLSGTFGILIKTVTSFTLGHSISLALATFGLVHVPAAPLGATIALSIVFLAVELVRLHKGGHSLTIGHPWVVAFGFGLVHGLGFATALVDIGLPESSIPLVLLFFNIGVEIGQLMFIFLVLMLRASCRKLAFRIPAKTELLPAYTIGSLAAFWFVRRLTVMF